MARPADKRAPRPEAESARTRPASDRGECGRWRSRRRACLFLPLPGTPGRGWGSGVSDVHLQMARFAESRFQLLSPALFPDDRAEGVKSFTLSRLGRSR